VRLDDLWIDSIIVVIVIHLQNFQTTRDHFNMLFQKLQTSNTYHSLCCEMATVHINSILIYSPRSLENTCQAGTLRR
jgi:hypothetical protein